MWSRRSFLTATAGAVFVSACSTDEPPGTVADDGSVTVAHAFGETRVPAPPTRVVSAGLTGADDLLGLGVVPVAVTDWFGGEPFGVWPWARKQLGDAKPEVLDLTDGVQVARIAALRPDLIVATNAGLDQDTYTELSAIAPTIPQSGQDAFFEPWRDQAGAIGEAVFHHEDMQSQIAGIDAAFGTIRESHPEFADTRVLLLGGTLQPDGAAVLGPTWRREFLTEMGLTVADTDGPLIARDRMAAVLGDADVLIWATESDDEQAALLADPVVARRAGRNVFTGRELAAAIAYASVLSWPVVAARLPTMIKTALG